MSESKREHGPSLLPYLDGSRDGLHIDIPALRNSASDHIESTGPFAALYEGVVSTGADKGLAQIMMLVQPDRYPPASSELDPITNVQVERLWQSAAERLRAMQSGAFPAILDEQLDDQGRLVPMRPMFHCQHRDRWCHPRCPHCGEALGLCRDDQALSDAGLPGYTLSLERFLYCAQCAAQQDGLLFYAPEVPTGSSEALRDGNHLLEGFSRLLTRQDLAEALPCVGCPESTNCYGPETLVVERMKPVFFFPFHVLFMPSPILNLKEFAELLSGRNRDDVIKRLQAHAKPGRARVLKQRLPELPPSAGLLFGGDDRRFLEVLYLKLTLLKALCALIPSEAGRISQPVGSMSLESVWVDLPVENAHLPFFWNFSLHLIDPVGQIAGRPTQGPALQGRRRYFLGSACCFLLLGGADQAMAAILDAVDKLTDEPSFLNQADDIDLARIDPLLTPRHLMDAAVATSIAPEWAGLWQRALLIGCRMLKAGIDADESRQEASFQEELDLLIKEIRQALFTSPAPDDSVAETTVDSENDAAIAAILDSILRSWPSAAAAPEKKASFSSRLLKSEAPPPPPSSDEDGDYVETVILGKEESAETRSDSLSEVPPQMEETVVLRDPDAPAPTPEAPSALDETVMIQREPDPKETSGWEDTQETVVVSPSRQPALSDDDLEKTVVLDSSSTVPSEGGGPGRHSDDVSSENDLEKTVVLGSSAVGGPVGPDGDAKAGPRGDDLEKTVILGAPSQDKAAGAGSTPEADREPSAPDEDDLEKTVVITPSTSKKEEPES